MRYIISVLFLVLAMEGVGLAEDKNKDREFSTTAGVFKLKVAFGSYEGGTGGLRHEILKTPDGKELRLFPNFRPDGTNCFEGVNGFKCTVENFSSIGERVYLVTHDGLWRWERGNFTRVDSWWEESLMVSGSFQTDEGGDVYSFIPERGDSKFRGILYWDKKKEEWVRAVDAYNKNRVDISAVEYRPGSFVLYHESARGDDSSVLCREGRDCIAYLSFFDVGKRVFLRSTNDNDFKLFEVAPMIKVSR